MVGEEKCERGGIRESRKTVHNIHCKIGTAVEQGGVVVDEEQTASLMVITVAVQTTRFAFLHKQKEDEQRILRAPGSST